MGEQTLQCLRRAPKRLSGDFGSKIAACAMFLDCNVSEEGKGLDNKNASEQVFSEQVLCGLLTQSKGRRQEFARTFRKRSCKVLNAFVF